MASREEGKNHLIALDILYPFSHLSRLLSSLDSEKQIALRIPMLPFLAHQSNFFHTSPTLSYSQFFFFLSVFVLKNCGDEGERSWAFFFFYSLRQQQKNQNKFHFAHIWFAYNLCGLRNGKKLSLICAPEWSKLLVQSIHSSSSSFLCKLSGFPHTHNALSPPPFRRTPALK